MTALCGLLLTGSAAWAGASVPPSEITGIELGWMVQEMAPLVEEVTGRRFVRVPEVVLASPHQFATVVYEEQLFLLQDGLGMSLEDAQVQAKRTASAMSSAFAGKYGFIDGRLYISVGGIQDSLVLEGAPDWLLRPVVRLVVAHELAHALQDQHTDLVNLVVSATGSDEVMAINCTVEGHAVWVHEAVGRLAGLDPAVELMRTILGITDLGNGRRRMDPSVFHQRYLYGLGRDFVAHHAEVGGTDQVWRVLTNPPRSTSAIVSPDRWATPDGDVDPNLRKSLRRATRRLAAQRWFGPGSARGWRARDGEMGDYEVRDLLVRAGADLKIADDLERAWNSRLDGLEAGVVEVQWLRFKSADGARAFVDDMRKQAETQARFAVSDPFISANAGGFDRVQADRTGREAITVSFFGAAVEDRLGRVWVARGPEVVSVVMVNAPATDRELAASIEGVFRVSRR